MKIYIRGTGTLAQAAILCCSRHFDVTNDPRAPGLDIFWVCIDTPIGEDDKPHTDAVLEDIRPLLAQVHPDTLVLISSQLPVGTTKRLATEFPAVTFACSPENIRVLHAVEDFEKQARIIVGHRGVVLDYRLKELFAPFTENVILTSWETAEMVKHTLNGFMALSIAYINEVKTLCEQTGADATVVASCVRLDPRVGEKARLHPGLPYSGGHLGRDVYTMTQLGGGRTPLIAAIKPSNSRKL